MVNLEWEKSAFDVSDDEEIKMNNSEANNAQNENS